MKELLQNDFFLEDTGLKVELANGEEEEGANVIQLRLRVVDPKFVLLVVSYYIQAWLKKNNRKIVTQRIKENGN